MGGPRTTALAAAALFGLAAISVTPAIRAQERGVARDLRRTHDLAVHAMVRIRSPGGVGTGWLLAQSGRPMVVTAKHVVRGISPRRQVEVIFYQGTGETAETVRATVFHRSRTIDMAILRLQADPPESARPIPMRTDTTVVRGERVVLGGNPVADRGWRQPLVLPFQTTEGVVTGHVSGRHFSECGPGRNCVVVDAASLGGSSGGPALNRQGQLVGMLWGGPTLRGEVAAAVGGQTSDGRPVAGVGVGLSNTQNPSLAYLIHTRTLAAELRELQGRR